MAKSPLGKAQDHGHHIVPVRVYIFTLIGLMILMGLTIAASLWNAPSIGPLSGNVINNAIALTIATIKGTLVILFFMHVKYATSLTKLWVLAGFTWLSLMFFILADYGTRPYEKVPGWVREESTRDGSAFPRDMEKAREERLPTDPMTRDSSLNLRPRG